MRYNSRNPSHFAASFPASEKGRFALWKWISKNTAGHVRGQGWYSPKDQEIVIFYKTPSARMDAILAVADHGVQGRVRSDLVPMKRAAPTKRAVSARTVPPHQAQDAAEKLGYYRTAEIVGPGGLSGASMAALVRLVEEASRKRNPFTGEGWSEHKAWLQEASKAEPKRVSSARAQEIIAQAQGRAKHGPWSDQIDRVITKGERKYISDVWDSLPGNTSFVDALVRIAQGRV